MSAPAELAAFCEREHARLVGALSLYCGDPVLAEELAQDALVMVCENWPSVSAMAAPGAWAHRVAMNLAKSRFRRLRAERRAMARRRNQQLVPELDDHAEVLSLRQAIASLPDRQREAVVMRYFLQWTAEETGEVIGLSASGVRSLTHRALQKLRDDFDFVDRAEPSQEATDVT